MFVVEAVPPLFADCCAPLAELLSLAEPLPESVTPIALPPLLADCCAPLAPLLSDPAAALFVTELSEFEAVLSVAPEPLSAATCAINGDVISRAATDDDTRSMTFISVIPSCRSSAWADRRQASVR